MPYIAQEKRDVLDPAIAKVLDAIRQLESDDPENTTSGVLNYIITRILLGTFSTCSQPRYEDINTVIGILECAKIEYYRRLAAPYENQKAHDNGDVYK